MSSNSTQSLLKAVILAAGKGTRLYPITKFIPKPLLPIVNRITLEYAFDQLKTLGIYEICLVVGETEEYIRQILKDGSEYGVRLTYVRQNEQLGLAHALKSAREFVGNNPFVLYLGDAIYTGDFKKAFEKFIYSDIDHLSLIKKVEDPKRFGVVETHEDDIIGVEEKPEVPKSNYVIAGLYFFRSKIWNILETLQPSKRGEYEITDAIKSLIDCGGKVKFKEHKGAWFDTGTLNSFIDTNEYLTDYQPVIHPSAQVKANLGKSVVIGERAIVECDFIERAIILPNSRICVKGDIINSIINGKVEEENSIKNQIINGGLIT